jgi:membrane-associated protease RseP (regulator of RpoE activity)
MSDSTPPASSTFDLYRPVEVFAVSRPRPRYWLHILLLAATIFSTLVVGARLQYNFTHSLPILSLEDGTLPLFPLKWVLADASRFLLGVPFALTLMLILLAHEMGHYYYCVRYGVYATLPFFIPAPTLIGTLGAFIRIKSPIRSRAALFDIGIAGPIAGFVASTLTLFFALALSKPVAFPPSDTEFQIGYPLIFHVVHWILGAFGLGSPGLPLQLLYPHPIALAAWVGMFATALNLLPGGQLDGGHIVYSLFPRAHKWITRIAVLVLVPLGAFWPGWWIWAILLGVSGLRHPQVAPWPHLDTRRRLLALVALALLILTFVPIPFREAALIWWKN